MTEPHRTIYTIGHSNLPQERFLDLLCANGIEVLIDTRSSPYSKFVPQFNKSELQAATKDAGIRYEYRGKEMGGKPSGNAFYDELGRVNYARIAETEAFQSSLVELEEIAANQRVAIFCAEENPSDCHRRLLIGAALTERGVTVLHIRSDGKVQTEEELASEDALRNEAGQHSLFHAWEVREAA